MSALLPLVHDHNCGHDHDHSHGHNHSWTAITAVCGDRRQATSDESRPQQIRPWVDTIRETVTGLS
jgi:hypothetical protein